MKLPQMKQIKWNYLALAFAFPFAGMLMVMLFSQYEPFGNYSMLYSDMYHQYYPFFVAFRDAILSGKGILYTWSVGMGLDYLGLISYYLASPLNLLSILVPEGLLLEYFSLLVPIKLGLAGLFFAIFLKKSFGSDDLSISLFGAFYGLCAWALGYQWNVMWLDTFALLPLVAMGTVSLLRDRKFILYTFTLFLSIYANYYVGFFVCIFVFLLFFCYEICRFKGFKRFFQDLLRIACFSILAIGLTAILELPTLAALQTTQSSVNNFPTTFRLNIVSEHNIKGLLDAMRQVAGNMGGGLEPTFKEGLPNIYSGVGSVMLAILFLTGSKIDLRDKICSVFLLLFFMLSFIIRQLDYIWHGFHFTNMIPYRFSFLFSFVLLYMAYRAYLMRNQFKIWQVILSAVIALGLFACSDSREDMVFVAYNLVFVLLYTTVLLYFNTGKPMPKELSKTEKTEFIERRKQRRTLCSQFLSGIMALELVLNLVNFGVNFPGTGVSNYPKGTESTASIIRYMKEREDGNLFYRTETTHSQTLNDGALNGYYGVSAFTSSANVKTTEFMKALGYGAKNTYNRYCFEESSPVANLFLGIKYMLERDGDVEENRYFNEIHHFDDVYLLENNAYLPLGFLADVQLINMDFSTSDDDRFAFQNELLKAASGIDEDVWHVLGGNTLNVTSSNVTITAQHSNGYTTYETGSNSGTVTYSYIADREGFFCIDVTLKARNNFTVHKNGTELYSEGHSLPQMLAVCDVMPGDVIEIRFKCKADTDSKLEATAAILDDAVFQKAYNILSSSTLTLTEFRTTKVVGNISCDRDGLLYTSIPQNGNWTVLVDGKETDAVLVGDCMISVPLSAGGHSIVFQYRNHAFVIGSIISLGSLIILLIISYLVYRPKQKKGKFERK